MLPFFEVIYRENKQWGVSFQSWNIYQCCVKRIFHLEVSDEEIPDSTSWFAAIICNFAMSVTILLQFVAVKMLPLSDFVTFQFTAPVFAMLATTVVMRWDLKWLSKPLNIRTVRQCEKVFKYLSTRLLLSHKCLIMLPIFLQTQGASNRFFLHWCDICWRLLSGPALFHIWFCKRQLCLQKHIHCGRHPHVCRGHWIWSLQSSTGKQFINTTKTKDKKVKKLLRSKNSFSRPPHV